MKTVGAILACLVTGSALAAETPVVTLVTADTENYPYLVGKGSKIEEQKPGLPVEIMKKVAEKLGIKLEITRMPWKRCLEVALKDGQADLAMSASYEKPREEFGLYPTKDGKLDESKRIYTASYSFYRRTDSSASWDGKTLSNFHGSISAPQGYSIVADLRAKGYTVEESPGSANDIGKLAMSRIEVIAELEADANAIILKNPDYTKSIVKMSPPIATKPYYVMISRQFFAKNPKLAQSIWDTIASVRDQDTDKIVAKY